MEDLRFRFENPDYLYLLFSIPVFFLIFVLMLYWRRRKIEMLGDSYLIGKLSIGASRLRLWIKFALYMFALIFIVLAVARPQYGAKLQDTKREGVELIIALDVSNSMMAEDIQPSRLERSKRAIQKLVDRLDSDKLGIIVFAGDAYMQLPVTYDYAAAKMFLSNINTDIVQKQGTAIGTAIELAMKSYSPDNEKNKSLIIITDGENHEDDAVEMAKNARENGIIIHTLGMGLSKGAPIPIVNRYGQKDYRKDKDGNVIISKLNEPMLKQIAAAGGGVYTRANNASSGLNILFDEINEMEKQVFESKVFSEYNEQFQYFAVLALFFLWLEWLIFERRNPKLQSLNLFGKNYLDTSSKA